MCVYDDVKGWNTLPYLGAGEFYLEYGDIDYTITAPSDMIVVGSGQLQNPEDVLTLLQRKKLEEASRSNSTVFIRSVEEVEKLDSVSTTNGNKTWHFIINNTRDASWAASRAFIWDAAKINLPTVRNVWQCLFILLKVQQIKPGRVLLNMLKRQLNITQNNGLNIHTLLQ